MDPEKRMLKFKGTKRHKNFTPGLVYIDEERLITRMKYVETGVILVYLKDISNVPHVIPCLEASASQNCWVIIRMHTWPETIEAH